MGQLSLPLSVSLVTTGSSSVLSPFSPCRPSGEKKPAEPKAMPDLSGYQIRV